MQIVNGDDHGAECGQYGHGKKAAYAESFASACR